MTTATKPKVRPFKKFYCDRPEVFLLPDPAFKIWMYHYTRENKTRASWPAVKTVMDACGIDRSQTFFKWRKYLITNGWLVKVGEKPARADGGRPVPIFKVTRGTIPAKVRKAHQTKGAESAPNPSAINAPKPVKKRTEACQKAHLEVDSVEVEQVEVKPTEVEATDSRSDLDYSPDHSDGALEHGPVPPTKLPPLMAARLERIKTQQKARARQ